ncbi:MAG: hypothetical protein ACOZF0_03030 [Thermodesulfobacteriota bacterium]
MRSRELIRRGRVAWLCFFFTAVPCLAAPPTPPDEVIRDAEAVAAASQDIFRKLFFSSSYNSLKCQDNIYNLLVEIRRANLDLSQVKVLVIFDKDHDRLIPTKEKKEKKYYGVERPDITTYRTRSVPSRQPPPNRFRYHVLAVVQDKVLDFDYTDSPAFPLVTEYVDGMFCDGKLSRQERRDLFNRLILRIISAEDYLRDHPQHPSYYLFDLDRKYPSRTVEEYLQGAPVLPASPPEPVQVR